MNSIRGGKKSMFINTRNNIGASQNKIDVLLPWGKEIIHPKTRQLDVALASQIMVVPARLEIIKGRLDHGPVDSTQGSEVASIRNV